MTVDVLILIDQRKAMDHPKWVRATSPALSRTSPAFWRRGAPPGSRSSMLSMIRLRQPLTGPARWANDPREAATATMTTVPVTRPQRDFWALSLIVVDRAAHELVVARMLIGIRPNSLFLRPHTKKMVDCPRGFSLLHHVGPAVGLVQPVKSSSIPLARSDSGVSLSRTTPMRRISSAQFGCGPNPSSIC